MSVDCQYPPLRLDVKWKNGEINLNFFRGFWEPSLIKLIMAISTVVHFLHLMKWKTNLKSEKRFSQITRNVEKVQTKSILYSIENNGWILR